MLTCLASVAMLAQQLSVSGNIKDNTGYPVPGAAVMVAGTTQGTVTDFDGNIFFPNMGRAAAAVPGGYMTIGKEESGKTVDVKQNQLTTALGVPSITGTNVIRYESSKWMLDGATVTGTTEQTDFTTLCIRSQQINYFNTGFQNLHNRTLLFKARRVSVNNPMLHIIQLFSIINSFSKNIKKTSQCSFLR